MKIHTNITTNLLSAALILGCLASASASASTVGVSDLTDDVVNDTNTYSIVRHAADAATGYHGKKNGEAALNPAFIRSLKSSVGISPFPTPSRDVLVQTTYLTSNSDRHIDHLPPNEFGYRPPVPDGERVGFVALNTNRDAHFDIDDTCVPIKEGNLIHFEGSKPHHTVVRGGFVSILGPFHLESMKNVGDACCCLTDGTSRNETSCKRCPTDLFLCDRRCTPEFIELCKKAALPTGSCCINGHCEDGLTEEECEVKHDDYYNATGIYRGDGTECPNADLFTQPCDYESSNGPCPPGQGCITDTCVGPMCTTACAGEDQVCCQGKDACDDDGCSCVCGAGLTYSIASKTCVPCSDVDQPCCDGDKCASGKVCQPATKTCTECGSHGDPCCSKKVKKATDCCYSKHDQCYSKYDQ